MWRVLLVALLLPGSAIAGEVSPLLLSRVKHPAPGLERDPLRVTIRFTDPPGAAAIDAVRAAGAEPVELGFDGALAIVGRVLSARVPRAALHRVAAVPGVERLEPAIPRVRRRPLDQTAARIGAPAVWSPPPLEAESLGRGVVVADHEFGWDPFHPDFFFPDGGTVDFIDQNRDGRAGAGDRVLLPCAAGTCEHVLVLMDGARDNWITGEMSFAERGYQPDLDWLYVDENGNGRRDYGAGFRNQPALGEPIFAGDDVNRNGRLDVGERLVRLGTPKVIAIWDEGTPYRRGQNLHAYSPPGGDGSHGTSAAGIVAAGWPDLRRYTGIAPGAELIFISSSDPVAGLAASRMLGAQIDFYEWDSLIEPNDGGTNFEIALSDAAAAGPVQLAAAGNLAGAHHCMRMVPTTTAAAIGFTTDAPFEPSAFYMSVTWVGPLDAVSLALTGGTPVQRMSIDAPFVDGTFAGIYVQAERQRTPRGTSQVILFGLSAFGGTLPISSYALEVRANAPVPEVRGLLADDVSGWSRGVAWLDHVTDTGTALMPSTADRVIAVGAFGGNHDLSTFGLGGIDEWRPYSGIGPRLDGTRVVDLAAPDDPYTPRYGAPGLPHGYTAFGGTSGALPHVAGTAALLLGADPRLTHDDVEAALKMSAISDQRTGPVPNEEVGHGRLHAGRALGRTPPAGTPPTIVLEAPERVLAGSRIELTATVNDRESGARSVLVAWDLDYDLDYEAAPSPTYALTVPAEATGRVSAVAKAIDPTGRYARAVAVIEVVDHCARIGCAPGTCCGDDGLCIPCGGPPDAGVIPDTGWDAGRRDATPIDAAEAGVPPGPPPLELEEAAKVGCTCGAAGHAASTPPLALVLLLLALVRRRSPVR